MIVIEQVLRANLDEREPGRPDGTNRRRSPSGLRDPNEPCQPAPLPDLATEFGIPEPIVLHVFEGFGEIRNAWGNHPFQRSHLWGGRFSIARVDRD